MQLPNFLIIGQMRAGSTALYSCLVQHPDVFMPEMKELRYFGRPASVGARPQAVSSGLPRTMEEYAHHFEAASTQTAVGEASPQYIDSPHAASQIKCVLPDARLIASIRNPADRLYSLYLLELRRRGFRESFREWLLAPGSKRLLEDNFTSDNLQRFYDQFPASQIKVVRFDDIADDLDAVTRELFQFLGVDPSFQVETARVHRNAGGVPRSRIVSMSVARFKRSRRLRFLARRWTPDLVWGMGRRIKEGNLNEPPPIPCDARREIADLFADDTMKLQRLTGLDLSHWLVS